MIPRRFRILALALLGAALAACATHAPTHAPGPVFVLVRHAEKATDDPRDPALTSIGIARAQRLADSLRDAPLAAVYATAYRRTQQTAAPTAQDHGLRVTTYDAKQPAAEVAAMLRQRHREGGVLVVGHSNTVPDIAAALCGCPVEAMPDTEYDRLITVRFAADGHATMEQSRQH
jgi:phosphohistidine phosphatase SixA